jgi:hypothetical protein
MSKPAQFAPPFANPTLRELYMRTHLLIIAQITDAIAENEVHLAGPAAPPDQRWVYEMMRNTTPLLYQRRADYEDFYREATASNDTELMRRFLENARVAHGGEPRFAFLLAQLPAV